jgi:hypothetical protein
MTDRMLAGGADVIVGIFVEAVKTKNCIFVLLGSCHDNVESQPFVPAAGPPVIHGHAHSGLFDNDRSAVFGQRFFFFHCFESSEPQAALITFCLSPVKPKGSNSSRLAALKKLSRSLKENARTRATYVDHYNVGNPTIPQMTEQTWPPLCWCSIEYLTAGALPGVRATILQAVSFEGR